MIVTLPQYKPLGSVLELAVTEMVAGVLVTPPWIVALSQGASIWSVVTFTGSAVLPLAVI